MVFALALVTASLFVSNQIVSKVAEKEKEHAEEWANTIRKKIELVQLTNHTFSKLRENERKRMEIWIDATKEVSQASSPDVFTSYEFPLKIISENTEIPVIVIDHEDQVSGYRNIDFDTSDIQKTNVELAPNELLRLFEDSLIKLSKVWSQKNPSFTIEVYKGMYLSYFYNDSKTIERLEQERDSLIQSFNDDLINNERLVPVLLIDSLSGEVIGTNVKAQETVKTKEDYLKNFPGSNDPLVIDFRNGKKTLLYYANSSEITQLRYFPYIQFSLIGLIALIGYLVFSTYRKAEQNQVWAGMAKETAHQLGTPLSSLMAWIQLLESQGVDPMITGEMQKDVDRLDKITDRFSKIGSEAKLKDSDLSESIQHVLDYLKPRISDKVELSADLDQSIRVAHNGPLMEWVIENICKNAVDAMEGSGKLHIKTFMESGQVHIDIRDTGKGLSPSQFKRIFAPGYTTKQRGWGLGLSLVKRIVQEYHKGRVFVLDSQINQGTCFRISIPL